MNIEIKHISTNEFRNLELDDVNYSGILFVCEPCYADVVGYQILYRWNLGRQYRIKQVDLNNMFYVENCDVQTIDKSIDLFTFIEDGTIKKIYVIDDGGF